MAPHFVFTSASGNLHSTFHFLDFDYSRYLTKVDHIALVILWPIHFIEHNVLNVHPCYSRYQYFLSFEGWINSIECIYHTLFSLFMYLCVHVLISLTMNSCIWAPSSFCWLWKMLQRTLLSKYGFKILLSMILNINPDVGELSHVIILFITFWGLTIPFSIVSAHIL